MQVLELRTKIADEARSEMSREQREYLTTILAKADQLLGWVTAQASVNYNLLPELYNTVASAGPIGAYSGSIPMVGYGAGAYLLTQLDKVQLYEHTDCGDKDLGDYPDAGPIDYYALRQDLVIAIRELQPDIIFTVDPWLTYEFHQDHVLTGRAASEAIGLYAFPRLKIHGKIDAQYHAHPLSAVAYYFTAAPNTFFDIATTWDVKQQAVRCYKLQFTAPEMERVVGQLEQQAREAGREQALELAEGLKVLHPSQLHIQTDTWKY